jgi:hypothetical protein
MVCRCCDCGGRLRDDGSCKGLDCASFSRRLNQRGKHWLAKRAEIALGKKVSARIGAFAAGGFACALLHRHDIRVGIASGMFLRHFAFDAARRLELLAVLYPCYWRWSTRSVLRAMVARADELASAGHDRRADIFLEAWDAMEVEMSEQQVVGYRGECRVDLLPRAIAKRATGKSRGRFGYHPYSNPGSRRTGAQEVRRLLDDVRDGSLWRACQDLLQSWQTKATYRDSAEVLVKHGLALWSGASYNRTRLSTLVGGRRK